MLHQLHRQGVEQLGMGGGCTLAAKIKDGGYQWLTKVAVPHMIDDHTGGERIFPAGDPAGQG